MTYFFDDVNKQALEYLVNYHKLIEKQKTDKRQFYNGCQERAENLLEDLKSLGINGVIIVINSINNLTHESGGLFGFHHVVLSDNYLVFDPNYTGVKPVALKEYIDAVYAYPTDIYIWKKDDTSKPIGSYNKKLYLDTALLESIFQK